MLPLKQKPESFVQNFIGAGVFFLLVVIGFTYAGVYLLSTPLNPEDWRTSLDGGRYPPTLETTKALLVGVLITFGLIVAASAAAAIFLLRYDSVRRKKEFELKESGKSVLARATEYKASFIHIFLRRLGRLLCECPVDGQNHVFKSAVLYRNPMPYFHQGQVKVFYDPNNLRRCFVDVDGSADMDSQTSKL